MRNTEHRSTSRVLDILELLAASGGKGYTLTEIAEMIDAPKSSIFPIINTLCARNFIYFNNKYFIGLNAFTVGGAFLSSQSIYEHIKRIMQKVVNACGEICQMGVMDNNEVLYIAKVDSDEAVQLVSHIGKRLPLYATALGKALIVNKSKKQLQELFLKDTQFKKFTKYTVENVDALYEQLEDFQKDGVSYEQQSTALGISCVATPICYENKIVASLSVSIPVFRCSDEKLKLAKTNLLEAKQSIELLIKDSDIRGEFLSFLNSTKQ